MKEFISTFTKGFGIGAANVIPGVSGGTVALITGIFERIIDSVKSFNLAALKLILKGQFKEFIKHTDLVFLLTVFLGALVSIFTLARLLDFLFKEYPVFVWSYFFGLILASVFFVARTVDKITISTILSFVIGTGIAVYLSFMNPATENDSFLYLIICGIAGIVSMIVPGLSGSFVLILMGNYQLIMIQAVNKFDMSVLIPVGIGAVIGLPLFSHALSWIYKKFRNQTIGTLTGFILGSLSILWPWKHTVYLTDDKGITLVKKSGEPIIRSYEQFIPEHFDKEVILAIALMLLGILSVWLLEHFAGDSQNEKEELTVS